MREVPARDRGLPLEAESFLACIATIVELELDDLPRPDPAERSAPGWTISRWLGGLGLSLARVADAASFSWPGPWIALIAAPSSEQRRAVVMYGVPSGMVWDPTGASAPDREESPDDDYVPASPGGEIVEGFLIAAADIALAMPPRPSVPPTPGRVETICVAAGAGEPTRVLDTVGALAGHGLDGDRHALGTGTFPSGVPGSALTLIEAEVCESFDPPLTPDQHRRNVVTRGIDLNGLVGRRFLLGTVLCRGMRLCEPCTVVDRYAQRPVLRALVHRGGLRADILEDGEVKRGDAVRPLD